MLRYFIGLGIFMSSPLSYGLDFLENTHLTGIQVGTPIAFKAIEYGNQAIYLKSGETLTLRNKYTPTWLDSKIDFITGFGKNDALIWGISTGQRASNMKVEPSLKLGWFHNFQISKQSTVMINGHFIFGGHIKEMPCYADYGFGKEEAVNCRLADKPIAPKQTLAALVNEKPNNHYSINIKYKYLF